jgi:hypothetical protein
MMAPRCGQLWFKASATSGTGLFLSKDRCRHIQIATISTDDHHTLQEFRASVGAQWTFLSDPERAVQKELEIEEYTDPEHNPMIPHTMSERMGELLPAMM